MPAADHRNSSDYKILPCPQGSGVYYCGDHRCRHQCGDQCHNSHCKPNFSHYRHGRVFYDLVLSQHFGIMCHTGRGANEDRGAGSIQVLDRGVCVGTVGACQGTALGRVDVIRIGRRRMGEDDSILPVDALEKLVRSNPDLLNKEDEEVAAAFSKVEAQEMTDTTDEA